MADIQTILDQILKARYGKDVRQSIHDGIQMCYDDAKNNAIGNSETLISNGNYSEKLPDSNQADINSMIRMNFSSGSENIPSNLPYTKWKKGMAVLLTLAGTSEGVYSTQIFFDVYDVWMRYKGSSWSKWSSLGNENKLLCLGRLETSSLTPDMNYATENRFLIFNYASGEKDIPKNTPYGESGWKSSTMAVCISLKGFKINESDSRYRTQIWIDTETVYFRFYGIGWSDWMNIGSSKNNITIYVNDGDSLLEKCIEARNKKASKMIVGPGVYDLIQEYKDHYGANYFTDYVDYYQDDKFDRGLWLTNIDVEFSPSAKVLANYDGSNNKVTQYFSAIAIGTNVSLSGLYLRCTNLRYGIHPDFSYDRDSVPLDETGYITFKNCDLKHVGKSGNEQSIGAGFGRHDVWNVEDCIFRSDTNTRVFRIHNNSSENVQSKLLMKNCYFEGPGFATFNYYGPSTDVTEVLVSNCSYINPPVVAAESSDYSNKNVEMLLWNNEQREE